MKTLSTESLTFPFSLSFSSSLFPTLTHTRAPLSLSLFLSLSHRWSWSQRSQRPCRNLIQRLLRHFSSQKTDLSCMNFRQSRPRPQRRARTCTKFARSKLPRRDFAHRRRHLIWSQKGAPFLFRRWLYMDAHINVHFVSQLPTYLHRIIFSLLLVCAAVSIYFNILYYHLIYS